MFISKSMLNTNMSFLKLLIEAGEGKILLFVYGTLKRNEPNYRFVASQEFLGDVETKPHYKLYQLHGFPAMVEVDKDGQAIHGEIYRVDKTTLHDIDSLEGHPYLYKRQEIEVKEFNLPVQAYIYQQPVDDLQVSDPDWKSKT